VKDLTAAVRHQLIDGEPDQRALYIVATKQLPELWPDAYQHVQTTYVDGYVVAISRHSNFAVDREITKPPVSLPEYLDEHRERLVCVVVKDEATAKLSGTNLQALLALGSNIDRMAYRGSYAALFYRGKTVVEEIVNDGEIRILLAEDFMIGSRSLTKRLELISGGYLHGNRASVRVGDELIEGHQRGLNVVVLDDDLSVLEISSCDTHTGTLVTTWFVAGERGPAAE
jgi:hypothetical protein